MAAFFINRPIFAWVLAILTMLAGLLAIRSLPVAQYPDIALPQIAIIGQYPGASASTVDQSVTQVIERQMKGIDNLLYMRSSSDAFGNVEIYFTFASGTDPDIAQVQVQNKLQQATPQLPQEVQRQGLQVVKSVDNSFMVLAFYVENDSMRANDISDYVASHLQDSLSRIQGVGSTTLYGGQNAMRVWLDPEKMRRFSLNPSDIATAIQGQNVQVAGGQVGAAPAPPGQEITFTVNASERLKTVEDFRQISLRIEKDGSILRLSDVARIELNEESFMGGTMFNGHHGVGIAFKLASGANVIETTTAIKKEVESLSRFFPPGMRYAYADDRAPIVEKSIASVARTLGEAIFLVVVVMFVFLQSFRATLIPAIAVPVVLLGVFAILALAGYSINTLTMFGMVLAIGLLVDDAIVVVENVERLMQKEGLSPKEAALKSMSQITGALVGIAAVISAVFVPMAFMSGSTGVIYRQFSITIVSSMILSVLVAIILTPALCATMLSAKRHNAQGGVFGRFNHWFERVIKRYSIGVRLFVRKAARWSLVYVGLAALCVFLFMTLPTAFLPDEDQSVLYVDVQLPPGSTFERTSRVLNDIDAYFRQQEKDAVKSVMTIMGWGFSGTGQASAMVIPQLKDWSERDEENSAFAVMKRASAHFATLAEAQIVVMAPPAVMELGTSSGFDMELMDRSSQGHGALMAAKNALLEKTRESPEIAYAYYSGLEDGEQYKLEVHLDKAGAYSLDKTSINNAIGAYWGGQYVNDFSDKGRTKKVYIQAEPSFRTSVDDFSSYYIRNSNGDMVPFDAFLTVHSTVDSPKLTRYQGVPSVKIQGESAPGKSSGQAMQAMEKAASSLPAGFDFAWTGLSYQEQLSGNQAPFLYAISLIVVFLCLAALYESWTVPIVILMAVPTGVLGALAGVMMRGMNNDIYCQIALLTIVGLSAKNSILIVEFAKLLHEGGKDILTATVEAARLRLRPIIMTSLCFILGVIPLAISSGAGSGAQNALGTAVMSGMISATALGIFYTPLFFLLVVRLFAKRAGRKKAS